MFKHNVKSDVSICNPLQALKSAAKEYTSRVTTPGVNNWNKY